MILSNVKLDHAEIHVSAADGDIATGLTKFGAIVGDRTEIGCNAVINPGSVLGRDCLIYPGANFRGVLPNASVVKFRQNVAGDDAAGAERRVVLNVRAGQEGTDGQGFEPWLPCGKHAFQACALDHSATHPLTLAPVSIMLV